MTQAFIASLVAGLATGLGALPLMLVRNISHWIRDGLLGFAAGVMVAAGFFSLLLPALEKGSLTEVILGFIMGALVLAVMEYLIPHIHGNKVDDRRWESKLFKRTLLMVVAIALHNIPEGFSVGIGYASGNEGIGLSLAIAIGVQNAPEGLLVAASLLDGHISKFKAFLLAAATGMVEPVAAMVGMLAVETTQAIIPSSLAFAAGAMLYVVYEELIPESHGHGFEKLATFSFIMGLIFMLIISQTLG